jgi:hypothetical protein
VVVTNGMLTCGNARHGRATQARLSGEPAGYFSGPGRRAHAARRGLTGMEVPAMSHPAPWRLLVHDPGRGDGDPKFILAVVPGPGDVRPAALASPAGAAGRRQCSGSLRLILPHPGVRGLTFLQTHHPPLVNQRRLTCAAWGAHLSRTAPPRPSCMTGRPSAVMTPCARPPRPGRASPASSRSPASPRPPSSGF